jgi:hypothetical protein
VGGAAFEHVALSGLPNFIRLLVDIASLPAYLATLINELERRGKQSASLLMPA